MCLVQGITTSTFDISDRGAEPCNSARLSMLASRQAGSQVDALRLYRNATLVPPGGTRAAAVT